MTGNNTGVLAFEDGSVFRGVAFGATKTVTGEACFNTSLTGYQEILTDPSYAGQIVTMTTPQIGNYGITKEDMESDRPKLQGFVVRDLSPVYSNWRAVESLSEFLERSDVPGIEGVDTRAITKKLRVAGAMKACLSTEGISDEEAVKRAKEWSGLEGVDYAKQVTCSAPYEWDPENKESAPFQVVGTTISDFETNRKKFKIAAIDFGAKYSIFRRLRNFGFDVHVFPATVKADEIKAIKPDGLFLSNGPGDPSAVDYAHATVKELIQEYPTFGICFGHQVITHALGAETFKLKFGHRGGNQPVKNLRNGNVFITAQNHGFASTRESIESCNAKVTEINLNDDTVAGLEHNELPVFSVQYHPEAAPGPNDAHDYFDQFYKLVEKNTQ